MSRNDTLGHGHHFVRVVGLQKRKFVRFLCAVKFENFECEATGAVDKLLNNEREYCLRNF